METQNRVCLRCCSRDCPHVQPKIPLETLTSTELRILNLVADGYSNKAIAFELGTTVDAVKASLYRVYRKIQVSDDGNPRVRATRWVREHEELVSPEQAA